MKIVQQNTFVKVATLQMIEMVFAGVEQSQMQIVPASHLTAEIQNELAEFRPDERNHLSATTAVASETEARLSEKLELWHKSLIERDQEFTALDLRSYCSTAFPRFENEVYAALAGFYRNLPPDALTLSKFDYVITQYFSFENDNNQRILRLDSEKIVAELQQLSLVWTNEQTGAVANSSQIRESIVALSKLSIQAKAHKTLKSWLESEFFNRSREVKRELGQTFFVPEVTTAVILCNLTLGNHFAGLCAADSAMLNNAAGILANEKDAQDVISSQLNSSFQTLLHSGLEEDLAEALAHDRLSNLFSLIGSQEINKDDLDVQTSLSKDATPDLEFAPESVPAQSETISALDSENESESALAATTELNISQNSVDEETSENLAELNLPVESSLSAAEPTTIVNASTTVTSAISANPLTLVENVLNELNHLQPDRTIVKNYLAESTNSKIKEFRFNTFLDVENETGDKNLRRVLRVVVSTEAMTRFARSGNDSLSAEFRDKLNVLNEEIQFVINRLRRSLSEDNRQKGHLEMLLYAVNTLTEIQFRLNSVAAPHQPAEEAEEKKSLVENELNHQNQTHSEKAATPVEEKPISLAKPQLNKWLLIAGATVVLLGGIWSILYLTTPEISVATNANVKTLDPKTLSGGNALLSAKVNKNTLFGFVDGNWSSKTSEQKQDALKSLLGEGGKHDFERVFLIGQNGALLGEASSSEIKVF